MKSASTPFLVAALASAIIAGLLSGCAARRRVETAEVVRTMPPVNHEQTIASYFAFTIANPPKNRKVEISKPLPGGCPVGGHPSSERGWVVPVSYTTYSGLPNGRDTIEIVTRDYYFWFRAELIAGVTSKMELCP